MRQEAEAYIELMDEKGIRHDDIFVLKSGKFDVESRWDLDETNVAIHAVFDDDGQLFLSVQVDTLLQYPSP